MHDPHASLVLSIHLFFLDARYPPAPMETAVVAWLMQRDDRDPSAYIADLLRRPAWMADAACKDQPTELFFPTRGETTEAARAICATCPVSADCLEYAVIANQRDDVGIWGGTSARQRRKIRAALPRPERRWSASRRVATARSNGMAGASTATDTGPDTVAVEYVVHESTPKTERSRRELGLDALTVAALRSHRARQAEERLAWGPAYNATELVFTRENGEPIHPAAISGAFVRLAKDAGLPATRLHDLRHSYASAALSAGVSLKVMQERLGHSSIAITGDIYSHVSREVDQSAADRVAGVILGAG
jgi:Transcription factor WhiB/Phage integrase family